MHKQGHKKEKKFYLPVICSWVLNFARWRERTMRNSEFMLTSRLTWTDVTLKLPYWIQYRFKRDSANSYSSLHLHFLAVGSDTLKCALCIGHSFHILQPVQCLYKYYSCDFSLIKANEERHPISLWKEHKFLSHTLNSVSSNQNLEDKRFSQLEIGSP